MELGIINISSAFEQLAQHLAAYTMHVPPAFMDAEEHMEDYDEDDIGHYNLNEEDDIEHYNLNEEDVIGDYDASDEDDFGDYVN